LPLPPPHHTHPAQQEAQRAQFIVERAKQERQEKVVRAEGEAEAARMISTQLSCLVGGFGGNCLNLYVVLSLLNILYMYQPLSLPHTLYKTFFSSDCFMGMFP